MTEHPTDDLGLYALGLLWPKERAAIERHLATCATCRAELDAHERTVATLAEGAAGVPRPDLREMIVARHHPYPRSFVALPGFALVTTLVLLLTLAASLVSLNQERATRGEYAQALAAVAAGAHVVPLQAQGVAGRGALVVSQSGASYLVLELPAPPEGKVYTAWLIRGGEPRAMGTAPVRTGVVTMEMHEELRSGDVAAVTVERAGVDKPTSPPILTGGI